MEKVTRISFFKKILRSKAFTLAILLAFLIVLFTILAKFNDARFFTTRTFIGILQDLAVPAFLAIGSGCLIVSGAIDLSQATVGAMSGVFLAIGIHWWGLPWFAAMLIALAAAIAIGFINAVIISELHMAPFIATIAMSSIIKAIMMLVSTDAQRVL
ncbi:MAG: ABC transporter permease [Clostridiales bacterium]|nr:ABC transporter permease [Clostridiales bacterium]